MRDLIIVLTIALVSIVVRTGRIPLQAEETRRGQFAVEMLRSGDWVMTTQQGLPFIDRPPAQYWVIAASFALAGGVEPGVNAGVGRWTLRAPTLISTVLTALLVWWFARKQWGDLAGLTAGIAYPTMAMILDIGRLAETEAQFALLLSASLLIWQYLYASGRPAWQHFAIGYTLCALAALTKGTQAPVAFGGMVVLILAWRRDWNTLFSIWHAVGIALLAGIIAIWQIPSFAATGWKGVWESWFMEASNRTDAGLGLIKHLATFPFQLLGELLPWSLTLLIFAFPSVRTAIAKNEKRSLASLLLTLVPIILPVWLVASANIRYAMPAVPIFAILIGIAISKSANTTAKTPLARALKWSTRGLSVLIVAAVIAMILISLITTTSSPTWMQYVDQPIWLAVLQAAIGVGAAIVIYRSSAGSDVPTPRQAVIAGGFFAAAFSACTLAGVYINRTRDVELLVHEARAAVPSEELVSLGTIHHQFVFNWPRPIPVVSFDRDASNGQSKYFVFNRPDDENDASRMPPFRWREITRIELNRHRGINNGETVIIGERLE